MTEVAEHILFRRAVCRYESLGRELEQAARAGFVLTLTGPDPSDPRCYVIEAEKVDPRWPRLPLHDYEDHPRYSFYLDAMVMQVLRLLYRPFYRRSRNALHSLTALVAGRIGH